MYFKVLIENSSRYCFRESFQKIFKKSLWKSPEVYLGVFPEIPSGNFAGFPLENYVGTPSVFKKKNTEEIYEVAPEDVCGGTKELIQK